MYDPLPIQDAAERYRTAREKELAASTRRNLHYRLDKFLEWCEEEGVSETSQLTGRTIDDYAQWLHRDVAKVTVKNHLSTVRDFVSYCERIGASPEGTAKLVDLPTLALHEEADDTIVESETASSILEYLGQYEYASLRHTTFLLLWHTGARMGSIQALDLEDYHSDGRWLSFIHRPDTGTPLKNKRRGEREVNLHRDVCEVLDDYISEIRPPVTDDYGREPLLATVHGRPHETTIQRKVYTATRPCIYTNHCPHDREIMECEARKNKSASKCPSSVGPHALRRGRITHELLQGKPKEYAAERMNVSGEVLEDHYDERTKRDKRRQRRDHMTEK